MDFFAKEVESEVVLPPLDLDGEAIVSEKKEVVEQE